MKREIIVGLILILIFGVVIAYYVASYKGNQPVGANNANLNQAPLTAVIVSGHATPDNCWVIIDGHVYNVTGFLDQHPGGVGEIIPYCGRDATLAFQTKAGKGAHSQTAYNDLAPYLVGVLSDGSESVSAANNNKNINATNENTNNAIALLPSVVPGVSLTASEVAKHASPSDCWFIYNSSVYNLTSYLRSHPGGAGQITPSCGKDATAAMNTKAGQGSHSSQAFADLSGYKIGTLNSTVSSVNATNPEAIPPAPTNPIAVIPSPAPSQNLTTLTVAEVARHAASSDCWFIYNSSVYNLTSYLRSHPGGAGEIIPYCGRDATQAFQTKAGQGTHSAQAFADLAGYKIGTLNSTVDNGQIVNTNQPPPNGNTNSDDEDDGENEDEDEDD